LSYRPQYRQTLCKWCAADMTEAKLDRAEFDNQYFGDDSTCHPAIKREFYSDYLAHTGTFAEYVEQTTSF